MARSNDCSWIGLVAFGLLGAVLSATSGLANPEPSSSSDAVRQLQRQVVELQQQAVIREVEIARLKEEIGFLEQELEQARRSAPAPSEDPALSEDPELVEESEVIGPIQVHTGIEVTELEEPSPPPPALPEALSEPSPDPADNRPSTPPPPAGPSTPPEALRLYDEGYTLFHQKRYGEAQASFGRYLANFRDTELADNAQFWIGECHYAQGEFEAALEAFTATVELYPDGNKVADALLKAGKCLEALGRREEASTTYQEVADRFPTSPAASAARERLEALR